MPAGRMLQMCIDSRSPTTCGNCRAAPPRHCYFGAGRKAKGGRNVTACCERVPGQYIWGNKP